MVDIVFSPKSSVKEGYIDAVLNFLNVVSMFQETPTAQK